MPRAIGCFKSICGGVADSGACRRHSAPISSSKIKPRACFCIAATCKKNGRRTAKTRNALPNDSSPALTPISIRLAAIPRGYHSSSGNFPTHLKNGAPKMWCGFAVTASRAILLPRWRVHTSRVAAISQPIAFVAAYNQSGKHGCLPGSTPACPPMCCACFSWPRRAWYSMHHTQRVAAPKSMGTQKRRRVWPTPCATRPNYKAPTPG